MKKAGTEPCPIAHASMLIGDMWNILIIRDLLKKDGPRRFNELQHSLVPYNAKNSINTRTLSNRLKSLERHGIITRTEFAHEMPPRVEYQLTSKGRAFSEIINKIRDYGERYC